MSVWVTNPFERFGKYYHKKPMSNWHCGCTLEQVKGPTHRAEIVQLITRNRTRQFHILWCQRMFHDNNGNLYYVHKEGPIALTRLTKDEIANARILKINAPKYSICERCDGETFCEEHHWAPQRLFEDANFWPTSTLCKECHRLWHRTVNRRMIIGPPQTGLDGFKEICYRCEKRENLARWEAYRAKFSDGFEGFVQMQQDANRPRPANELKDAMYIIGLLSNCLLIGMNGLHPICVWIAS
jgi:hypothetical protein